MRLWGPTRTGSTNCSTSTHTLPLEQVAFYLWKLLAFAKLGHTFWTYGVSTAEWEQIQPPQPNICSKTENSFGVLGCKQFLSLPTLPGGRGHSVCRYKEPVQALLIKTRFSQLINCLYSLPHWFAQLIYFTHVLYSCVVFYLFTSLFCFSFHPGL